jgi:hypothetical protein
MNRRDLAREVPEGRLAPKLLLLAASELDLVVDEGVDHAATLRLACVWAIVQTT